MHLSSIISRPLPRLFTTALLLLLLSLPGCNRCNCDHGYYKLCDDHCVMRGSQFGDRYDLPCSDNVSFMMAHKATGIEPDAYEADFITSSGSVVLFQDADAALALHDPLFPAVTVIGGTEASETVTFTLDNEKVIQSASLYIRVTETNDPSIAALSFAPIINNSTLLRSTWIASGPGSFLQTIQGNPPVSVNTISFSTAFPNLDINKLTFITYKFEVKYTSGNQENMEITFALRDYHNADQLPNIPAPVYVQGHSDQLVDILMVPARDDQGPPLSATTLASFREKSRLIIRDVVFGDPTMRFWRKQFNFWINKQEGEAVDYDRCSTCCHTAPPNDVSDFELKALLHQADQRDFADNCDSYFSAEMDPEKTAFLHELGHAAFWLKDEYPGYNGQSSEHFPNNWDTKRGAEDDATLRHKTRSDARLITF
jgi:hypothetical protein